MWYRVTTPGIVNEYRKGSNLIVIIQSFATDAHSEKIE